ncbi:hypothetical protein [Myxosarcina sp. GI1(2024)]
MKWCFFFAGFGALMNPALYLLIGTSFLLMGLVLLPPTSRLTNQLFNWQINGGTKTAVILIGFILIYLFVPQVETQPSPYSKKRAYREKLATERLFPPRIGVLGVQNKKIYYQKK